MTAYKYDVFLSHNSKNKAVAAELAHLLKERNVEVWCDASNLLPGDPTLKDITNAIVASRTVAVLVGEDGMGPWQEKETDVALQLAIQEGRRVIPVLLNDATSAPQLPPFLSLYTWLDLRAKSAADSLQRLIDGIYKDPGEKSDHLHQLAQLSLPQLEEKLQDLIRAEYLVAPLNDRSLISQSLFDKYSGLFPGLIDSEAARLPSDAPFFEWLSSAITDSPLMVPFTIESARGAGKTTLLSLLYWYLHEKRAGAAERPLPVFFDMIRYSFIGVDSDKDRDGIKRAGDLAGEHLRPLAEWIRRQPNKPVIVIIDGFDSSPYSTRIAGVLFDTLQAAQNVRLLGVPAEYDRSPVAVAQFGLRKLLRLSAVPVGDDRCGRLIDAFLTVAYPQQPVDRSKIESLASRFRLSELDLFLLSALYTYASESTFSGVLERCCREDLRRRLGKPYQIDQDLDKAARLVFQMRIKSYSAELTRNEQDIFRMLVRRHPRIEDYLEARFLINALAEIAAGEFSKVPLLDYSPFGHRVARLCKELVNSDDQQSNNVLKAVERLLSPEADVGNYARANICYLAGRVAKTYIRRDIRLKLRRFKEQFPEPPAERSSDEFRKFQMLQRTLHVSLIILGDHKARDEYIDTLLSDARSDLFNRGFHLEYYGDQRFVRDRTLVSVDALEAFPRTFSELVARITENRNGLFELQLQTLCSLAQHRHAEQRLSPEPRHRLLELMKLLLAQNRIKHAGLRAYVRLVYKNLQCDVLDVGSLFAKIYRIKEEKRRGWVKRGIQDPESVADHMYGAYLIGLCFPPEEPPDDMDETEYSKQKILSMLLIHDLGEAIVGDKSPQERNPLHDDAERSAIEEISMLGTYRQFATLREIASLFDEFEAETSINAMIAREIDRIENWVQLWTYSQRGEEIRKLDEWDAELRGKVNTTVGCSILAALDATYGRGTQ